jgi:magnesium transporter
MSRATHATDEDKMQEDSSAKRQKHRQAAQQLLEKNKLMSDVVHKQDMPHHDLVETLVRKQNLARLDQTLEQMEHEEIAEFLESLAEEDQLFVWGRLGEGRKEIVLRELPLSVLQVVGRSEYRNERFTLKAFDLTDGRLHEIEVDTREDLAQAKPIWVDLVAPSFEERLWVGDIFGIELPDPDRLGDLESSARFYVEGQGEIHLHSEFLLDKAEMSRNVAVAFIMHDNILFSIRKEELPVFRLQRLRALAQPHYVSGPWDVLLDLYAADVEYSADALEDVYKSLENVGKLVLSKHMTDEEAAAQLTSIAHEEDVNGRIRRNVLDTRRAVSFLMRSKFLAQSQFEDARQILRDIESLDNHTAFLFEKINFLMDAMVGFVNINQNKVIKQLTVISIVFMPLNVLAGILGMSEFSMMTHNIPWPVSYGAFLLGTVVIGWLTYELLRFLEKRKVRDNTLAEERKSL